MSIITQEIQARALLVRLTVNSWQPRIVDRDATDELQRRHESHPAAAEVRKRLLAKDDMRGITAATSHIREEHYKMTLPWDDQGMRVLPVARHRAYEDAMQSAFDARMRAVDALLENYDEAIADARLMLGSLFAEGDYPSRGEVREKYAAACEYQAIPRGQHLEAILEHSDFVAIRDSIERNADVRMRHAVSDVFRRFRKAVAKLAKHIDPDGNRRVHASVLEGLREVVASAAALNVTEDPDIAAVAAEIAGMIDGVTTDNLRPASKDYDPQVRQDLHGRLSDLSVRLAGYG